MSHGSLAQLGANSFRHEVVSLLHSYTGAGHASYLPTLAIYLNGVTMNVICNNEW